MTGTDSLTGHRDGPGLRRAELLAALSLAVDLGLGQPMEHVLRSCLIGVRLGEAVGLDEDEQMEVFYAALLAWVGCHAVSPELAAWFHDDISYRSDVMRVDKTGLPLLMFLLGHLGAGTPLPHRVRLAGAFLVTGRTVVMQSIRIHCQATAHLAERLGLGAAIAESVQQIFERWDGKGWPSGLAGDQLRASVRIVQLVNTVEACHRSDGLDAAVETARQRRGTHFDPGLVDVFCANAAGLLGGLAGDTSWERVLDAEPGPRPVLSEQEFDRALEAMADFADLKTPCTTGHSRGVAELAAGAGGQLGMAAADRSVLRRAGLVHDLGRLGVSNAIWDKPGPLGRAELERVRLHPYLTERILARPGALRQLGSLAALHHEHLDGSGYPHGLSGATLPPEARILAAADAYHAMTEPRPHRPALPAADAAAELRAEVRAGRLDGQAADAVLAAAGHRVRRQRDWPSGLTTREVEVLALVAQGQSSAEIARRLVISQKTVRNHVEHVYAKIGVSGRVGASLFAMQHGLLGALHGAER